ncbi:aminotransferase class I/II-fold pyridoxal phosphate-dependent enzyme [Candidatus Litorirhabdus singularis]|uniref:aminotransferase class I/II-fold pyridoxal phosphate-dependent enzyme n=1 Tax=Candidatus Litorirhabdus singularis TaxID=2518993 RepID=UPI002430871B|nr:aminotransferase class I/II-fold pyridoxal phosphate-dependent enzyme [Candidatus Litorirhabdus singularis]
MHIDQASKADAENMISQLEASYQQLASSQLNLDLTRGKPSPAQVALASDLDGILQGNYVDADGIDTRNYGGLAGIREARELCAAISGCDPDQTLLGVNSSLNLMYQVVEFALNFGLQGDAWKQSGAVRILCPVPGYDRHFALCEHLGIDMVPLPMTATGPDMDQAEALVREDPAIKGIWCVPRFSNPSGDTYSSATVERLAKLGKIAGAGFLVLWDNAYAVHSLYEDAPVLPAIDHYLDAETESSVVQFGSTSKITFAGAGLAWLCSSADNIKRISSHLAFSTIGADKVNQLRHVRFLQNRAGVEAHMRKHAELVRPRFELVLKLLEEELEGSGLATWTKPKGGYFIQLNTRRGLAREVVKLAADIGVKLTPAGATWPYGRDPRDSDIRLAPTFPDHNELEAAVRAFIVCLKLASWRQLR